MADWRPLLVSGWRKERDVQKEQREDDMLDSYADSKHTSTWFITPWSGNQLRPLVSRTVVVLLDLMVGDWETAFVRCSDEGR